MKKALLILLGLAGALVALAGVQLARLDPEPLRGALEASAGEAFGAAVRIEALEIGWLPPALRLRGVRGEAPDGNSLLVRSLRVQAPLSVW